MIPVTLPALLPSPVDDRDFAYVTRLGPYPDTVDMRNWGGVIEVQMGVGSCVACSTTSAYEMMQERAGRLEDLSRQFVYDVGRIWEQRRDQPGMFLRDGLKVAHQLGIPLQEDYPYRGSETTDMPSDAVIALASARKLGRYERIDPGSKYIGTDNTALALRSALSEGCPVVFAAGVGEQIFTMRGPLPAQIYELLGPTNAYAGMHAMVFVGYDKGGFIFENSWGDQWGDKGYGYWHDDCLQNVGELWVIRGFAGIDPTTAAKRRWCFEHSDAVRVFVAAHMLDPQTIIDAAIACGLTDADLEGLVGWPAGTVRAYAAGAGKGLDWREFLWT